MLDTQLQPTSTTKSKDKSSEQRFGNVNDPNSYLNIVFIQLIMQLVKNVKKLNIFKLLRFFSFLCVKNLKKSSFF